MVKLTSVEKALMVLDHLGKQGDAKLTDVSREVGISRATAFRALATLEKHGYVTHKRPSATFTLGPRIGELARGLEADSMTELASTVMAGLSERTGETVNLAVLRRGRLVYSAIVEGSHSLRMSGVVGEDVPFHATALGKAFLAMSPPAERERLLGRGPWRAFTPRTITQPADLAAELAAVAERGFALDREEIDTGAICVAAAIRGADGRPAGALSISAVSARMSIDDLRDLGPGLRRSADAIGEALASGRPTESHGQRPV